VSDFSDKATSAVVEYFHAWDQVRRITSELRSRRCEFEESGDQYSSGTPPCYHDNRSQNEDGSPIFEQWCEVCIEGRKMFEERKGYTKTMRLKLDVIRRLGKRLSAKGGTN
jgi:hypothetical protein